MTQPTQTKKGFTIIEVLIVLAIAGLILLIVFLAVPALQRNSRNTQRRNDASALLGAANEYATNNGGRLPTTTGDFSVVFVNANPNLGYYTTPANVDYNYSAAARVADPTFPPAASALDSAIVYNYAKCGSATTVTRTGATARSIAVLFVVEGSGGSTVNQCVES